jgi:multiple sugar transport system permease protein
MSGLMTPHSGTARPARARTAGRVPRLLGKVLVHGVLLCVVLIVAAPFCWVFSTSLRLPKDSFTLPPAFWPTSFHLENYQRVFELVPYMRFVGNSIFVSAVATAIQVVLTGMAGYAFSRITFRGRNALFILILSGLMIPYYSTVIPLFLIMKGLGLIDTRWSLILPAMLNPLGIFLVRQFMLVIPRSYDEAAFMDGAGHLRVFWEISMPMAIPSILITSVMWFIKTWNEFFYPLVFLTTWEKMTLPLGLTVLSGYGTSMNPVTVVLAGLTLSIVPPVLFYLFGQRYLLRGTSLSGIKA